MVKISCWEFKGMDRYMQQLDEPFIVIWNAISIIANSVSIFLVYYEAAFRLNGFEDEQAFAFILECVLIADIILNFFKAYYSQESHRGWIFSLLGICGACKEKKIKGDKLKFGEDDIW